MADREPAPPHPLLPADIRGLLLRETLFIPRDYGLPVVRALDNLEKCRPLLPRDDANFRLPPAALAVQRKQQQQQQQQQQQEQQQQREEHQEQFQQQAHESNPDSSDVAQERSVSTATAHSAAESGQVLEQDSGESHQLLKRARTENFLEKTTLLTHHTATIQSEEDSDRRIHAIDVQRRQAVTAQITAARRAKRLAPTLFERILERAVPGAREHWRGRNRRQSGGNNGGVTSPRSNDPMTLLLDACCECFSVCIITRGPSGIRGAVIGTVRAFDKHFNIIIGPAEEYDCSNDEGSLLKRARRTAAMLFIKGDTVVMVQRIMQSNS